MGRAVENTSLGKVTAFCPVEGPGAETEGPAHERHRGRGCRWQGGSRADPSVDTAGAGGGRTEPCMLQVRHEPRAEPQRGLQSMTGPWESSFHLGLSHGLRAARGAGRRQPGSAGLCRAGGECRCTHTRVYRLRLPCVHRSPVGAGVGVAPASRWLQRPLWVDCRLRCLFAPSTSSVIEAEGLGSSVL